MAAASSQEASSSTFRCYYHVFLSFRGKDTRKTFTDHLYTALNNAGIHTFRDDEELQRGEDIEGELHKAIQQSKVLVIVFSEDYASSRWCLDELLQILELKKTGNHKILPIFYHVDPSQVRNQTGSFADALAKHEEKFKAQMGEAEKEGMAKVEKWKTALREVANLAGMELKDGHESKFIQNIVKETGNKLHHLALSVPTCLIGIDHHVRDINWWIQDESPGAEILMICGMSGVGKTTIAKTVYNQNMFKFDGCSFLADIREKSEQPNGLVCLQKLLLSDILKGREVKVGCVDEGIMKIKDAICCKRVLVVLDDVDHLDQLNAIVKMREWFYPGSKIIITTKREDLLKPRGLYEVHNVKELSDDDSLQLFNWHAFGQNHPLEGYMEHSEKVVSYCGGLPLALEVLGCYLRDRTVDVWKSAISKLKEIPDTDIFRKLKISYDFLDDHDQMIFLDITCFFVGETENYARMILDACGFHTKVGIRNLVDRCLLTIDKYERLKMHRLLQDMGREVVRQESAREPGKRSRLWHHEESLNVLREKTGTETIECLALKLTKENKAAEAFSSANNTKRNHTEAFQDKSTLLDKGIASKRRLLGFFSWLPVINPAPSTLCSASTEVVLPTDAFSRMHNLRLLQLNNVQLTGGFADFPKRLRWLRWHDSTLKSFPSEFTLESLVALDMLNCRLKQVWKGTKVLESLKILNLSYSPGLTRSPAFSGLPNLERLILEYCTSLTEVHESIGELGRLVLLNLKGCEKLRKLPRHIGFLKCLEELILSGCSSLEELPTELGNMESLAVFHADGIDLFQKPSSIREVKPRSSFFLSPKFRPQRKLESNNFSLSSLTCSLKDLSLRCCNLSNDAILEGLCCLSSLHKLDLSENPIFGLPESITGLTKLQFLTLSNCRKLKSLPGLPMSLRKLQLFNCSALRWLPKCSCFLQYVVMGCSELVEIEGTFKLEPLRNMDAESINFVRLFNLEFIGDVEVVMYNSLTEITSKGPPQVVYEYGIFSTFIPGSVVPYLFRYQSTESFMCIKVPSLPNRKIQGLNICVIFLLHEDEIPICDFNISVSNKTQDLKWDYYPTCLVIPTYNVDMMWLSHWTIDLEEGDEVTIIPDLDICWMKRLGIQIVYSEQEREGSQHSIYPPVDLSPYQQEGGTFFLESQ